MTKDDKELIYTVEYESYDGGGLEGIYRTKEEARDKLKRLVEKYRGWYKFKSPDVLAECDTDGNFSGDGRYLIYERKFGDVKK